MSAKDISFSKWIEDVNQWVLTHSFNGTVLATIFEGLIVVPKVTINEI